MCEEMFGGELDDHVLRQCVARIFEQQPPKGGRENPLKETKLDDRLQEIAKGKEAKRRGRRRLKMAPTLKSQSPTNQGGTQPP